MKFELSKRDANEVERDADWLSMLWLTALDSFTKVEPSPALAQLFSLSFFFCPT